MRRFRRSVSGNHDDLAKTDYKVIIAVQEGDAFSKFGHEKFKP